MSKVEFNRKLWCLNYIKDESKRHIEHYHLIGNIPVSIYALEEDRKINNGFKVRGLDLMLKLAAKTQRELEEIPEEESNKIFECTKALFEASTEKEKQKADETYKILREKYPAKEQSEHVFFRKEDCSIEVCFTNEGVCHEWINSHLSIMFPHGENRIVGFEIRWFDELFSKAMVNQKKEIEEEFEILIKLEETNKQQLISIVKEILSRME